MGDKLEYWGGKWENDEAKWQLTEVHPRLQQYRDKLLRQSTDRIFVPLCGKTLDLKWLVPLLLLIPLLITIYKDMYPLTCIDYYRVLFINAENLFFTLPTFFF